MHSPSQTAFAKQLGLSQVTVSRALRNDLRIAEETRKRVWDAAEISEDDQRWSFLDTTKAQQVVLQESRGGIRA